jgi:transposase
MIRLEQWMDIKDLHRQGHSIHAIVRLTGHGRNTVRKVLRQKAPEPFKAPRHRKSILDPFKPYLTKRFQECALSGVRLFEEIQAQGYTGSLDTVQIFLKTLKAERTSKAKLTVRFETAPGQQAQADWAEIGRFEGVKVYAFVMVLSFSRMLYVEFTTSMALPELIRCHQNAFAYFGGMPGSILYDNMAQVRMTLSGKNGQPVKQGYQ